jgi:transcriptional antiterminator RfaH
VNSMQKLTRETKPLDASAGWYVVYTKPKSELVAQENLERQGYRVRLALVRKVVRRRVGIEPLFPRYLFFKPDSVQQSLSPVRSTVGVSSIVRFGVELAMLPDDRCQAIMDYAQAQQQGGIESIAQVEGLTVGQKVLVKTGPFVGLEGLVSGVAKDRILVLMSLLGKEQTLGFEPVDLSSN